MSIEELKAENARLKTEVEHLMVFCNCTLIPNRELQAENARLKAEVEMHSKPAIIGGYNLSQYIRMANSETLEFDNGDIFADMTLPERIKYIVESHARLKAEVERLNAECNGLIKGAESDVAYYKAQVERLTKESDIFEKCCEHQKNRIERLKAEVDELTLENSQYEEHHKYGQNVIEGLREQVERLTKAGDAMCKSIDDNGCDLNGDWDECLEVMKRWHAAKEGKQS